MTGLLDYTTSFEGLFAQTLPVSASNGSTTSTSSKGLTAEYIEREADTTRVPEPVTRLVESTADRHQAGILTNGTGRMQRRKLEQHGLDGPWTVSLFRTNSGHGNRAPIYSRRQKNGSRQKQLYTSVIRSRRISCQRGARGSTQSTSVNPSGHTSHCPGTGGTGCGTPRADGERSAG